MLKLYAGIAVAAIVAAVGGTLAYTLLNTPDDQFAECRATSVAGGAGDIGGPFTLVNSAGATVTDADIITGPTPDTRSARTSAPSTWRGTRWRSTFWKRWDSR